MAKEKKLVGTKSFEDAVNVGNWRIVKGRIKRPKGRVSKKHIASLFRIVAEKIPWEAFEEVRELLKTESGPIEGIYVVHDSMSYPRYIGQGNIFNRIKARFKAHPNELKYFSFYVVKNAVHIQELESMLIHVCSSILQFNTRKKRLDTDPGSITDYLAGITYIERQKKRGKPSER